MSSLSVLHLAFLSWLNRDNRGKKGGGVFLRFKTPSVVLYEFMWGLSMPCLGISGFLSSFHDVPVLNPVLKLPFHPHDWHTWHRAVCLTAYHMVSVSEAVLYLIRQIIKTISPGLKEVDWLFMDDGHSTFSPYIVISLLTCRQFRKSPIRKRGQLFHCTDSETWWWSVCRSHSHESAMFDQLLLGDHWQRLGEVRGE